MENLPDIKTQLALLIDSLRCAVVPPLVLKTLGSSPPPLPRLKELALEMLQRTQTMTNDAELRFWLLERATKEEALCLLASLQVIMDQLALDDPIVLAHVGGILLSTPMLLTVCRTGLQLIEKIPTG